MPSKKTRPIGTGVRNVPVTLSHDEVLGLETVSNLSGVGRSPYLRTLVQWAIENRVILRPRADEYAALLRAIKEGVSPLPRYRFEPVVTQGEVFMLPGVRTKIADDPSTAKTVQAVRAKRTA